MKLVQCKNCALFVDNWCNIRCDSTDPDLCRDCQHFQQKTILSLFHTLTLDKMVDFLCGSGMFCSAVCPRFEQDSVCCVNDCKVHCKAFLEKEVHAP